MELFSSETKMLRLLCNNVKNGAELWDPSVKTEVETLIRACAKDDDSDVEDLLDVFIVLDLLASHMIKEVKTFSNEQINDVLALRIIVKKEARIKTMAFLDGSRHFANEEECPYQYRMFKDQWKEACSELGDLLHKHRPQKKSLSSYEKGNK